MPNRNRFTNMLLAFVAGLLILNLVVGRSQTSRAATPTEYKQIPANVWEIEKTLNASAKDGWELAQIYSPPHYGDSSMVYVILKK